MLLLHVHHRSYTHTHTCKRNGENKKLKRRRRRTGWRPRAHSFFFLFIIVNLNVEIVLADFTISCFGRCSKVFLILLKWKRLADCNVIQICLMKNWYPSSYKVWILFYFETHTHTQSDCVDRGSILLHKGRFPHWCVLKKNNNRIFLFLFFLPNMPNGQPSPKIVVFSLNRENYKKNLSLRGKKKCL
jgi:hypothetical protein